MAIKVKVKVEVKVKLKHVVGMLRGGGIPLIENKKGFLVSWFLRFKVYWFLRSLASWFPGFKVPKFQISKDPKSLILYYQISI